VTQPPIPYVIHINGQLNCDLRALPAITQVMTGDTTDASIMTVGAYVQNQGELISLLRAMHHVGVLIVSVHRNQVDTNPVPHLPR
jgi:hypothetical protein